MKSEDSGNNRCVINPSRTDGEKQLSRTGILACNPTDSHSFKGLAATCQLKSEFLFHSNLYAGDRLFLAGPAVGAPMATLCLEKLIALGARRIILYGWCGSLQKDLHAMDVLVPTTGISEEGTSLHYQPPSQEGREILPSTALRDTICKKLSRCRSEIPGVPASARYDNV